MDDNRTHPYALEIMAANKPGTFQWTIRRHGKLIQRSDRVHRSLEEAQKDGEKAVERQFSNVASPR